jgi:hypothetical protein
VLEFDFIDPTFKPDPEPENYIVCPPDLRDRVIDLIRKHFNMHPKIPINAAGQFLTADEIRIIAVHEIYDFCTANKLVLLWTYLWSAWYKMTRWVLWARSTRATIPLGKTNMLVEAHWRVVKHCYLYRFNRPRLDYLVWVICTRLLPDQVTRFDQMCLGRILPSWFDDFKNDWKQLTTKPIADESEKRHYTDMERWICSCPSFLNSRFLICKHLVHLAVNKAKLADPQGIRLLYSNFQRREDYPFLVWDSNKLRSTFERASTLLPTLISQSDTLSGKLIEMGEDNEILDLEIRQVCELKVAAIRRMAEHLEQELTANNLRHVMRVVNNTSHLFTMLDDIEMAQRRQLGNSTWRKSTPWTLFLQ